MMHHSTKIIAAISLCFFLACVTVSAVFITRVSAHKEMYETKIEEQAREQDRAKALRALSQKLEDTRTERESLRTRIVHEDDMINFLALIQTLGKEQQVELATSNFTEIPINETFDTLSMQVQIKGSYESVMHTLALFEQLPYQTAMSEIRLMKEGDEGLWNATFTLRVTKYKKV